jgi:hypothetical protein
VIRRRIPLAVEPTQSPAPLDHASVRALIEEAMAFYKGRYPRYSPSLSWHAEDRAEVSVHVRGFSLTGHISLLRDALEVVVDVPFLLRPFQKLAIARVEEEVSRWLRGERPG